MMAISLDEEILGPQRAYLAGVLFGDGWCTRNSIGLHVKDVDFCEAFCEALNACYGTSKEPRRSGLYWRAQFGNKSGTCDDARGYEPRDMLERARWVRGLFDSEGNANCAHQPQNSPAAYSRKIRIFSTVLTTLKRAASYLSQIGVRTSISQRRNGPSHYGTKVVYELNVHGREGFTRFRALVGSSIARKRRSMDAIVSTYQDPHAHVRRAQALGAATRRTRTMRTVLPAVIAEIAKRIQGGAPTTLRATHSVPGYHAIAHYFKHSEIVEMAKGTQCAA